MSTKDNSFGLRLRMLRTMNGNKSQKDFAAELGIPQPTLSAYESGKIKPTVDVLINISNQNIFRELFSCSSIFSLIK